ncbi:MAG: hypothetical protein A2Z21_07055 [Candidatus Fraserbacteria bacterium RBG_16_55_9]|uniref:Uncharacterized protein n=1 Tax=Fraserbacteria sp. (strain RBG_16_55_9) TaxID=1817864 RepID=A0A1F5UTG8_FRAXR|nr:MAG: hypothetical protein A2Z21_07055 [Candidatus Fraserbacteria bacterium RBG_16_55_9]
MGRREAPRPTLTHNQRHPGGVTAVRNMNIHDRIAASRDRAFFKSHKGRVSTIADRPPVHAPSEGDSNREYSNIQPFYAFFRMIRNAFERISEARRLKHEKAH